MKKFSKITLFLHFENIFALHYADNIKTGTLSLTYFLQNIFNFFLVLLKHACYKLIFIDLDETSLC